MFQKFPFNLNGKLTMVVLTGHANHGTNSNPGSYKGGGCKQVFQARAVLQIYLSLVSTVAQANTTGKTMKN